MLFKVHYNIVSHFVFIKFIEVFPDSENYVFCCLDFSLSKAWSCLLVYFGASQSHIYHFSSRLLVRFEIQINLALTPMSAQLVSAFIENTPRDRFAVSLHS